MPTTETKKRITKQHRVWTNKKHQKVKFNGSYEYITNKKTGIIERLFCLTEVKKDATAKRKSVTDYCNSPEDAKAKGWKSSDR